MAFEHTGIHFTMCDGLKVNTEVVTSDDSVTHTDLYILLENMISSRKMVVGFDTEWVTDNSYSKVQPQVLLLKFYTADGCVLVRTLTHDIPIAVKMFLASKDAIFVGVKIREDLERLKKYYGVDVRNNVELSDLAAEVHRDPRLRAYGSRQLAFRIAYCDFRPRPVTVVWSDWGQESLSHDQIECATIDAYAAYKIGVQLLL